MDESVIFVQELRSGDADICVFESRETNPRCMLKRNCKKPYKPIPLIDLSRDSGSFEYKAISNKNLDLENIEPSSSTEIKTNVQEIKKINLECPVCLESMENLEIITTNCGHLFCKNCIEVIIDKPRPMCPKCRELIIKKSIRRVFL